MTLTLEEAVAEVKRLWAISAPSPDETNWAAIVFNAVASGDLIPKADAERAVAQAYQRAGDALLECSVWCDSQERTDDGWRNGVTDARKHHMARILALAPADALAEVQEIRSLLNYATDVADRDHARAEAAEAEVERLREAFRVNMLRYGPPGTSHEDIDATLNGAMK